MKLEKNTESRREKKAIDNRTLWAIFVVEVLQEAEFRFPCSFKGRSLSELCKESLHLRNLIDGGYRLVRHFKSSTY